MVLLLNPSSGSFNLDLNSGLLDVNFLGANSTNDFDIFVENFVDVIGSIRDDSIIGNGEENFINGGEGNDTINGGGANDVIVGGGNADSILGGDGDDSIIGLFSPDTLDGGAGDDTVEGGANGDLIFGSTGNDILDGQNQINPPTDGTDIVDYNNLNQSITLIPEGIVNKGGGTGTDTLLNIDHIIAPSGEIKCH